MSNSTEQLSLNFNPLTPQAEPVIWQWNKLSPQVRSIIVEYAAGFNSKAIKLLPKKEAVEIEPWIKCTLNGTMKSISQGWVDLRFD